LALAGPLPSLNGETVSGSGDGAAFCLGANTPHFTASGTATGPYPGTFSETGNWSTTSFNATFVIVDGETTVEGSKSGGGSPCLTNTNTVPTVTAALSGPYTATINTPTGTLTDQGTASGNVVVNSRVGSATLSETFTSTPPDSDLTLDQPSNVTGKATSTAGAKVTYTNPAAHDEDLSTVSVNCLPASGSTFAIGDTTVTCTASDSDGDTNSPAQTTFTVHVKGASEQLSDLATAVQGVGAGTSLADQVASVQSDLSSGEKADACGTLGAFINTVKGQQRGGRIAPGTATMLISTAQRIEAVIGC
jgi:hypothetical protein